MLRIPVSLLLVLLALFFIIINISVNAQQQQLTNITLNTCASPNQVATIQSNHNIDILFIRSISNCDIQVYDSAASRISISDCNNVSVHIRNLNCHAAARNPEKYFSSNFSSTSIGCIGFGDYNPNHNMRTIMIENVVMDMQHYLIEKPVVLVSFIRPINFLLVESPSHEKSESSIGFIFDNISLSNVNCAEGGDCAAQVVHFSEKVTNCELLIANRLRMENLYFRAVSAWLATSSVLQAREKIEGNKYHYSTTSLFQISSSIARNITVDNENKNDTTVIIRIAGMLEPMTNFTTVRIINNTISEIVVETKTARVEITLVVWLRGLIAGNNNDNNNNNDDDNTSEGTSRHLLMTRNNTISDIRVTNHANVTRIFVIVANGVVSGFNSIRLLSSSIREVIVDKSNSVAAQAHVFARDLVVAAAVAADESSHQHLQLIINNIIHHRLFEVDRCTMSDLELTTSPEDVTIYCLIVAQERSIVGFNQIIFSNSTFEDIVVASIGSAIEMFRIGQVLPFHHHQHNNSSSSNAFSQLIVSSNKIVRVFGTSFEVFLTSSSLFILVVRNISTVVSSSVSSLHQQQHNENSNNNNNNNVKSTFAITITNNLMNHGEALTPSRGFLNFGSVGMAQIASIHQQQHQEVEDSSSSSLTLEVSNNQMNAVKSRGSFNSQLYMLLVAAARIKNVQSISLCNNSFSDIHSIGGADSVGLFTFSGEFIDGIKQSSSKSVFIKVDGNVVRNVFLSGPGKNAFSAQRATLGLIVVGAQVRNFDSISITNSVIDGVSAFATSYSLVTVAQFQRLVIFDNTGTSTSTTDKNNNSSFIVSNIEVKNVYTNVSETSGDSQSHILFMNDGLANYSFVFFGNSSMKNISLFVYRNATAMTSSSSTTTTNSNIPVFVSGPGQDAQASLVDAFLVASSHSGVAGPLVESSSSSSFIIENVVMQDIIVNASKVSTSILRALGFPAISRFHSVSFSDLSMCNVSCSKSFLAKNDDYYNTQFQITMIREIDTNSVNEFSITNSTIVVGSSSSSSNSFVRDQYTILVTGLSSYHHHHHHHQYQQTFSKINISNCSIRYRHLKHEEAESSPPIVASIVDFKKRRIVVGNTTTALAEFDLYRDVNIYVENNNLFVHHNHLKNVSTFTNQISIVRLDRRSFDFVTNSGEKKVLFLHVVNDSLSTNLVADKINHQQQPIVSLFVFYQTANNASLTSVLDYNSLETTSTMKLVTVEFQVEGTNYLLLNSSSSLSSSSLSTFLVQNNLIRSENASSSSSSFSVNTVMIDIRNVSSWRVFGCNGLSPRALHRVGRAVVGASPLSNSFHVLDCDLTTSVSLSSSAETHSISYHESFSQSTKKTTSETREITGISHTPNMTRSETSTGDISSSRSEPTPSDATVSSSLNPTLSSTESDSSGNSTSHTLEPTKTKTYQFPPSPYVPPLRNFYFALTQASTFTQLTSPAMMMQAVRSMSVLSGVDKILSGDCNMKDASEEELEELIDDVPEPANAPLQIRLPRVAGGYLGGLVVGNIFFPLICCLAALFLWMFYKVFIIKQPIGERDMPMFDKATGKLIIHDKKKHKNNHQTDSFTDLIIKSKAHHPLFYSSLMLLQPILQACVEISHVPSVSGAVQAVVVILTVIFVLVFFYSFFKLIINRRKHEKHFSIEKQKQKNAVYQMEEGLDVIDVEQMELDIWKMEESIKERKKASSRNEVQEQTEEVDVADDEEEEEEDELRKPKSSIGKLCFPLTRLLVWFNETSGDWKIPHLESSIDHDKARLKKIKSDKAKRTTHKSSKKNNNSKKKQRRAIQNENDENDEENDFNVPLADLLAERLILNPDEEQDMTLTSLRSSKRIPRDDAVQFYLALPLIECYSESAYFFVFIDTALIIALFLSDFISVWIIGSCNALAIMLICSLSLHLIIILIMRPYTDRLGRLTNPPLEILQIALLAFVLAKTKDGNVDDINLDHMSILQLVLAILQIIVSLFSVSGIIIDLSEKYTFLKKKKRLHEKRYELIPKYRLVLFKKGKEDMSARNDADDNDDDDHDEDNHGNDANDDHEQSLLQSPPPATKSKILKRTIMKKKKPRSEKEVGISKSNYSQNDCNIPL